MGWSNIERAKLRHFMGVGEIFLQTDPRMENAMNAMQSVADGGTRPDDSALVMIRAWLAELEELEAQLARLRKKMFAVSVDKVVVDPARGMLLLRSEGRRLVHNIATSMSVRPRRDVFSSAKVNPAGGPYFIGDGQELSG